MKALLQRLLLLWIAPPLLVCDWIMPNPPATHQWRAAWRRMWDEAPMGWFK